MKAVTRLPVGVLTCLGVGAMSLALADPPAASPAPSTAGRAAAARREVWTTDYYEKHFLAEGYKMELHNGEKMFCRMEEPPGSRLEARKVCSTLDQLKATETGTREWIARGQRISTNPKGH